MANTSPLSRSSNRQRKQQHATAKSKNPNDLRSALHSAQLTTFATPGPPKTPGHKTWGYNGFKGREGEYGAKSRTLQSKTVQCINTYTDKGNGSGRDNGEVERIDQNEIEWTLAVLRGGKQTQAIRVRKTTHLRTSPAGLNQIKNTHTFCRIVRIIANRQISHGRRSDIFPTPRSSPLSPFFPLFTPLSSILCSNSLTNTSASSRTHRLPSSRPRPPWPRRQASHSPRRSSAAGSGAWWHPACPAGPVRRRLPPPRRRPSRPGGGPR